MKKNTKIAQYTALIAAIAAVGPIACKKDATDEGDPNISVNELNLVLQNIPSDTEYIRNFDVNEDGIDDFQLYLRSYAPYYGTFVSKLGSNEVLKYVLGGNNFMRNIPYGQTISDTSYQWGAFGRGSLINTGQNDGFAGEGDIYSGIRFKIGTYTHYGWIRYNIDANSKKITLKDAAYDTRPDIPIKAGAR